MLLTPIFTTEGTEDTELESEEVHSRKLKIERTRPTRKILICVRQQSCRRDQAFWA